MGLHQTTRIFPAVSQNVRMPLPPGALPGLPRGTRVMTLTGAKAVERLWPGERVITRNGAAELRAVAVVAKGRYSLHFDAPQVVFLDDGQADGLTGAPYV